MAFPGKVRQVIRWLSIGLGLVASGCLDSNRGNNENGPTRILGKVSVSDLRSGAQEKIIPSAPDAKGITASKALLSNYGGVPVKSFDIDVKEEGGYYLSAWADGKVGSEIQVLVDGEPVDGASIRFSKGGWQNASLERVQNGPDGNGAPQRATLLLGAGSHNIGFVAGETVAPNFESIRLGLAAGDADFSSAEYDGYLDKLIKESRAESKTGGPLPKTSRTMDDPLIDYGFASHEYFTYTWYTQVYLTASTSYTFETLNPSPSTCDPILYVFLASNPTGNTWVNDDYSGHMSRVSFTAPSTGYYYILLRSFESATGTVQVNMNGSSLATDCAVAANKFYCGSNTQSGVMNYFTAQTMGDTRIWLLDDNGYVRQYNDDYAGSGDFIWGTDSRIKEELSQTINYALLSVYGSNVPYGYSDVYMKLANSSNMSYFPNLEADDAIQTAPGTYDYNCISWSGGVTTEWYWPPDYGNPWYVSGNDLQSFDKFYSNKCASTGDCARYSGAWNYTRSGFTSGSSLIDLWKNGSDFTHASVTNPANDHPHGYDWESKPGTLERMFHSRNALEDNSPGGYGAVANYYGWDYTYAAKVSASAKPVGGISQEESIRLGLSVAQPRADFSVPEYGKIHSLSESLPAAEKLEFEEKFQAWKRTWKDPRIAKQSNPHMYAKSGEYRAFLEFCRQHDKQYWPALFAKFAAGDIMVINVLNELVLPGREAQLDELVQEWVRNPKNPEGKQIIFSQTNTWVRFLGRILDQEL
jgi:hypothetical protein